MSGNIGKSLSSKWSQKLIDQSATQSATVAFKSASKWAEVKNLNLKKQQKQPVI